MRLDCLEGNGESLMNNGDSGKCSDTGGDSGSVSESMVLETCSYFGSINSSISALNMTQIGANNEDAVGDLVDKKITVAAPGSIESNNYVVNGFPDQKARIYQEQMIPESESIFYNPSSTIQMQRTTAASSIYSRRRKEELWGCIVLWFPVVVDVVYYM